MDFWPDRYLGDKPQQDPLDFAFGFGRRVCPGRYLADAAVWITMAKLLATVNVTKPIGKDGKEYLPEIKMTPGLVRYVFSPLYVGSNRRFITIVLAILNISTVRFNLGARRRLHSSTELRRRIRWSTMIYIYLCATLLLYLSMCIFTGLLFNPSSQSYCYF